VDCEVLRQGPSARDRGEGRLTWYRTYGELYQYFRTGNAAKRFNQLDSYVWRRLVRLRVQRKGRHLRAGEAKRWTRESFRDLGLHRLRGTVRYPEPAFFQEAA
jgi:hypothetical protein